MFSRNSWEDFLSKLLPINMYIMSQQMQRFIPDSKHVISEKPANVSFSKDDFKILKIQQKILNKIVIPILKKEYQKDPPLSNKKIKEFLKCCMKLSEITYDRNNAQELAEMTLMIYQQGIDKV